MTQTLQRTVTVRKLLRGDAIFDGMASWYHVPPHLEPILRTAQEKRRDVTITFDRNCNVHAAELLPPSPWIDRLRDMGMRARFKVIRR